jgi:hypothetical protein
MGKISLKIIFHVSTNRQMKSPTTNIARAMAFDCAIKRSGRILPMSR